MDFDDTAEEAAFRVGARAWLEADAERRTLSAGGRNRWRHPSPGVQAAHVAACQHWQRTSGPATSWWRGEDLNLPLRVVSLDLRVGRGWV